jgi:hypothetical protein
MVLITFSLPLELGTPVGFGWDGRSISQLSTVTAFDAGVEGRDTFLGQKACVVCGTRVVDRCHIIPQSEEDTVSQNS